MTTTTDETTHLRALLVEQTAQASRVMALLERAEFAFRAASARANQALACNEAMREPMAALRAAVGMPAEGEGAVIAKVLRERAEALAANAEMRAALECAAPHHQGGHSTVGRMIRDALARPDLAAGMVVVPREVAAAVVDALNRVPSSWGRTSAERAAVADLEASLKKGGAE